MNSQQLDKMIQTAKDNLQVYVKEPFFSGEIRSAAFWKGYVKALEDVKKELTQ